MSRDGEAACPPAPPSYLTDPRPVRWAAGRGPDGVACGPASVPDRELRTLLLALVPERHRASPRRRLLDHLADVQVLDDGPREAVRKSSAGTSWPRWSPRRAETMVPRALPTFSSCIPISFA